MIFKNDSLKLPGVRPLSVSSTLTVSTTDMGKVETAICSKKRDLYQQKRGP